MVIDDGGCTTLPNLLFDVLTIKYKYWKCLQNGNFMGVLRTGLQLTKTIRNVGRLKEIVSVFMRNGFDSLVLRTVVSKIPGINLPDKKQDMVPIEDQINKTEQEDFYQDIGMRLRACFEQLGPAFIKFGQLLSSREDLFPSEFIQEMKILRDKVSPVPFADIESVLNEALGKKWEEVFETIEKEPIGTASIGVVYKAKLHTGENVVVKVKRPGIEKDIKTDLSIIIFLAGQLEKASSDIRYLGITRVLKDFALSLQNELNFNIEAMNCQRFADNIKKFDSDELFYIPKIYKEHCSNDVLVMEFLEGFAFSDNEKVNKNIDEIQNKIEKSVGIIIKTFLLDGFFHADLHGGNFFYLPNGRIGLIDYGLMGTLGKKSRLSFVAILYALISNDFENLVYEFLDVAEFEAIPDVELLIKDLRDSLSPFIGLTVQQTDFTLVLKTLSDTLRTHRIYLPRDWFIVFRALMTLDGVGKSLNMDIDLFNLFTKDIGDIVKNNFKKEELLEDAGWAARDIISSSRVVPRHMRWFLKEWSKNGYAFEIIHKGHEKQLNSLSSSLIFLGNSILSGIVFISGVFLIRNETITSLTSIPTISWLFWGISIVIILNSWRIVRRN